MTSHQNPIGQAQSEQSDPFSTLSHVSARDEDRFDEKVILAGTAEKVLSNYYSVREHQQLEGYKLIELTLAELAESLIATDIDQPNVPLLEISGFAQGESEHPSVSLTLIDRENLTEPFQLVRRTTDQRMRKQEPESGKKHFEDQTIFSDSICLNGSGLRFYSQVAAGKSGLWQQTKLERPYGLISKTRLSDAVEISNIPGELDRLATFRPHIGREAIAELLDDLGVSNKQVIRPILKAIAERTVP